MLREVAPGAGLLLRHRAAPVALGVAIIAFAAGSSPIPSVTSAARTARWVLLFALAVTALGGVALRRSAALAAVPWRYLGAAAFFTALAIVSAGWSVDPRLSVERGASFAVMLIAAVALAVLAAGDRVAFARVAAAVLVAAVAVGLVGVLLALAGSDYALQRATALSPWRYQGFGMNPNTDPMLYALAIPIAAWLAITRRSLPIRSAASAGGIFLTVLIILSESRGALLASFGGTLFVCTALLETWRRRAVAALALSAVFAGGNVIRVQSSPPLPTNPVPVTKPQGGHRPKPGSNPYVPGVIDPHSHAFPHLRGPVNVRPEDEIGHPAFGQAASVAGSGRLAAWRGTLAWQVRDRPILGYGFGTESQVFVDRWYYFEGALPEDSYLGLLLELGVVGLLAFLAVVAVPVVFGLRAFARRRRTEDLVVVGLGVVVAGLLLMLAQSFVYSVGNVATLSFWCILSLLAVARTWEAL